MHFGKRNRITIDDVAKKASVSRTTVSRVMNQNYHHITEETKQKVLQAIQELDFRPNALAKGLKQMKTNTIGVILSNLQNPFWLKVLEGIEYTCQNAGYSLMIVNSGDNLERETDNIKGFQMRQVDGMIINPSLGHNSSFELLDENRYPFVFLNRKVLSSSLQGDSIVVDNIKGVSLAIDHFVKLNRKKIAIFLYPPEGISPRLERLEGYKSSLMQHHLKINESYIKIVKEKGDCPKYIEELFQHADPPNAILSTNNMLTLELLSALKGYGLKIPQDVGIIGYDETDWSKHLTPPLTTIEQPAFLMGKAAAEKLMKKIIAKEQKEIVDSETIYLEPILNIRSSCGEIL